MTVKLPGSGAILRAILWANAGDVKHDPQWIKIWSAYEGEDWKLIDVLDVRHLQGTRMFHGAHMNDLSCLILKVLNTIETTCRQFPIDSAAVAGWRNNLH